MTLVNKPQGKEVQDALENTPEIVVERLICEMETNDRLMRIIRSLIMKYGKNDQVKLSRIEMQVLPVSFDIVNVIEELNVDTGELTLSVKQSFATRQFSVLP